MPSSVASSTSQSGSLLSIKTLDRFVDLAKRLRNVASAFDDAFLALGSEDTAKLENNKPAKHLNTILVQQSEIRFLHTKLTRLFSSSVAKTIIRTNVTFLGPNGEEFKFQQPFNVQIMCKGQESRKPLGILDKDGRNHWSHDPRISLKALFDEETEFLSACFDAAYALHDVAAKVAKPILGSVYSGPTLPTWGQLLFRLEGNTNTGTACLVAFCTDVSVDGIGRGVLYNLEGVNEDSAFPTKNRGSFLWLFWHQVRFGVSNKIRGARKCLHVYT